MDYGEMKASSEEDRINLGNLKKTELADVVFELAERNRNFDARVNDQIRAIRKAEDTEKSLLTKLRDCKGEITRLQLQNANKQGYINRIYEQEDRKDAAKSRDNRRRDDRPPRRRMYEETGGPRSVMEHFEYGRNYENRDQF